MGNLLNPASLIRYAALSLAALLPFLIVPAPWATSVQSKMLLASLVVLAGAAALGVSAFRSAAISFPRSLVVLVSMLLPLVYLLSALFSGTGRSSFYSGTGEQDTVFLMVLFVSILLLGAYAFRSLEDAAAPFFRASIAGGLALMAIQVCHVLLPGVSLGLLATSTSNVFGSWHEVAIIAGLYVFLVVALFETPVLRGAWRWTGIALAALSVCMLLVVNMIDVWYVFGGLMLAFAVHRAVFGRALSRAVIVAASIGVLAVLAGIFGGPLYSVLPERFQVLQVEVRPSWEGTFAIGMESIDGVRTALLGTGPNTFSRQWSLYKPLGVNTTEFWNADFSAGVGAMPTTFITVGILGLAAWALLVLAVLWRFARTALNAHVSRAHLALFAAVIYLTVFHILYVPTVTLSLITFLLLGLLALEGGMRGPWRMGSGGGILGWSRTGAVVLGLVIAAAAALFTIRAVMSDLMVSKSAYVYNTTQDTGRSLSLLARAIALDPGNDRAHRAAVELGLIRLGQLSAAGDSTDQARAALQSSLEATIQHGLAAVSIGNGDYRNWLALAGLYRDLAGAGVQGAYENARMAYEQALADSPNNPIPLVQMAQLEIAQNRLKEAVVFLDEAIRLKPDFAAAYFLRSNAHSLLGDTESAVRDAATAVQTTAEDPLGWYNLGTVLYDAGRYLEASQALEQAAALQADYANALFVLGLAYDKLGRSEEALDLFEYVAQRNPNEASLQAIIENLRAGRSAIIGSSPAER